MIKDIFDPSGYIDPDFWVKMIDSAFEREDAWRQNAKQIEEIYRGEVPEYSKFNILFSNTNVLKASIYARNAKPEISRRFGDPDPLSRAICTIQERVINYSTDKYKFFEKAQNNVLDYLKGGRGVLFVCYKPEFAKLEIVEPSVDMFGRIVMEKTVTEQIEDQKVYAEYVYWNDFAMSDGRVWDDIWWVARRHYLTESQIKDLMWDKPQEDVDAIIKTLSFSSEIDELSTTAKLESDKYSREEVWEIWCKPTKQRLYLAKGSNKIILIETDPYKLSGFFPCAEPCLANRTSKDMRPYPFFDSYRPQALELNVITERITKLIAALKRRGAYDTEFTDALSTLENATDNEFVPIPNMAQRMGAAGLSTFFASEDLLPIITVVQNLYTQRDMLVNATYEISGISDIIRGASNPNETATAQKIKGNFAGMRLKDMQSAIHTQIRDTYEIMAELVAEHFEQPVLARITGLKFSPEEWLQIMQQLRDEKLMAYRVDIETDSTAFDDKEEAKASINEFMTAVSGALGMASQIMQVAPEMGGVFREMINMAARTYKVGRQFEDELSNGLSMVIQRVQANAGINMEAEKMKLDQAKVEIDRMRAQTENAKAQGDYAVAQANTSLEALRVPMEAQKTIPMPEEPLQ